VAIALVGLGLALSAFALQWYMGKKADEEASRPKERRHRRGHASR
jgi:hypothetical protein